MAIYDVKKVHRRLYAPPQGRFDVVDVPPMRYLAVDGHGDPNTTPAYPKAVRALYAVAYTLRSAQKAAGRPFVVSPLEGLWRATDPAAFVRREKSAWNWTMLIALPEWVSDAEVTAARRAARTRTDVDVAGVDVLAHDEGRCVQTLHVGSYDDEGPVLDRLHREFMPEHGLTFHGDHHEIYLGDPRRTPAERLRTVLRQPVRAG
ncbi:GyrI-like domain-containing protein [Georgenia deserti]|uniref:GyrI-like domain-containing protein n=1 Tax=Georgenia deserti TaxID=2093781 RepID=A0ABW4L5V8_9MICO